MHRSFRRGRKDLGLVELIAIALGGMVGGGIFSILGISVEQVGNSTPIAILIGGVLALCAAYSYVKLALLYKDEGATYSFFKRSFPDLHFAASAIGWLVIFGYISTLALYAFTFSSYLCGQFPDRNSSVVQKIVAGGVILLFSIINVVSVRGMGRAEDWMVYLKMVLIISISAVLALKGDAAQLLPLTGSGTTWEGILVVAAITFVAYEGFQLVIHAYNEMDDPQKNIPKAIYSSVGIATLLYVMLAIGALAAIPKETMIADKEYALAAGAELYLGRAGAFLVVTGALLATSSAINGTLFGASRLMAVVAEDGYLPAPLTRRVNGHVPARAILTMAGLSFLLILSGGLQLILEFGSITFIIVSFFMARANYKVRRKTNTRAFIALFAMLALMLACVAVLWFEYQENRPQLIAILGIYSVLFIGSYGYSGVRARAPGPRDPHT
ncbi:MAG: APC family permease [Flavobacteriales bacterium]|nr:APC family permease [Flavobacteriales bacterium]